ncbi:hypothetical protein [Aneurinibacillus aneurinilyticus]|jgi:hypothetical protein|uniref:Uncharacterized protein n=1 Tax=Aneurinibacillus aneurinilyticus ATCC 12856 TaxID=649747 RepID=U1YIQ3_ANEAE|nr:hypothetical protein [Aneurinibacillus aneurinilyticus]ERI10666.1 hypothetical protein HMPREF0083_01236 [Aneurinibacillus aneurinilyticus ATCC 12856]MCI1695833.1 hypothetical protein [Aneurinibacillus aneurinilyticus]MED0704757.1 hypothetical protein [Aneurinibacillus aneurinilyticus]MED0722640.1 hypothetical protein [Aneurinibacillus aneurinilyticus]MED0730889.1 hypothetical protein [Aneurinibacillus aneurinilyticus]
MEYFIVRQDQSITNPIIPLKTDLDDNFVCSSVFGEVVEKENAVYLDYLDKPRRIVSEDLKKLFSKYEDNLDFTAIVFTDVKKGTQRVYWIMDIVEKNCISHETTYYPDGRIKELVINPKKVELDCIFQVDSKMETFTIVNLDVAESMLRRPLFGIQLQRVKLERR